MAEGGRWAALSVEPRGPICTSHHPLPPLESIVVSWGRTHSPHPVFMRLKNSWAVIFPFGAPFTPNPAAWQSPIALTPIIFLLDVPESLNKKYIVLKELFYIILGLSLNPSFTTSDSAGQSWKLH